MRSEAKPPSGATSPASEASLRAAIQEMAQKLDRINHFEVLGISRNAGADEVSLAFVRAARQFHPDRLAGAGLQDLQPIAERILARINEAAMVLDNATRRADYVASLAAGPRAAPASLPTVLEAENSFLKGEVFLKKGDYGKAIECFAVAAHNNPDEPQYRAYLAWARFEDPRMRKEAVVRETLKVVESVMQDRPRFARGHYWVGLLWKFLNEPGKAERAFREAVAVDGGFIDASRELRLSEMRKTKVAPSKPGDKPEPPHGGLKGKLFKK
jgi:tetratricopeptide (TPR) repeat protein